MHSERVKRYFNFLQFVQILFPRIQLSASLPPTFMRTFLAGLRKCQSGRRWIRGIKTESTTKNDLRILLRETAQPVAVVTSHYPFDEDNSPDPKPKFHGATLSSFTSVALDPHPLVAFSLRIPSRMSTALKQLMHEKDPCMVINLLSASQREVALRFSRADLYPHPFRELPYVLSKEGLPILSGSLGALSCTMVSCTPLDNVFEEDTSRSDSGGIISELFLSHVARIETVGTRFGEKEVLPLLYHRRQYATTRRLESQDEEGLRQ